MNPLTFVFPVLSPGPASVDLAEPSAGDVDFVVPVNYTVSRHGLAFLKRAKAHAERCGMSLQVAADRVDDPLLAAIDLWHADVRDYARKHKCSEFEAYLAVPVPI